MIARQLLVLAWGIFSMSVSSPAEDREAFLALHAQADYPLTVDPETDFWKSAGRVAFTTSIDGSDMPQNRTEVRSRWTNQNLYLLFICHYQQLSLKPNPDPLTETNHLWNWDVAEAFIGSDFEQIRSYKEFEVSPQGEWVDLDIGLDHRKKEPQAWNSGFKVKASIDAERKVWYGAMCIPFGSLAGTPPKPGLLLRINLFRCEGATADRKLLAWKPTHAETFHKPEYFGILRLEP